MRIFRKEKPKEPASESQTKDIRISIVGLTGSGKSSLTSQYFQRKFVDRHNPTVLHSFSRAVEFDNETFMIQIDDTSGREEYEKERDKAIENSEGFICVYSVDSLDSFSYATSVVEKLKTGSLKTQYKGEKPSRIPIVICCNKVDVEDSEKKVPLQSALRLCSKYDAAFMETSAKDHTQARKLFHQLLREMKRVDSAYDFEKYSELKGKRNLLEWFLTRRPTKRDLISRNILPDDKDVVEDVDEFGRKRAQTLSGVVRTIRRSVSKRDRPNLETLFNDEQQELKTSASDTAVNSKSPLRTLKKSFTSADIQRASPKKISGPMMYPEAVQQPETADIIAFSAQPPRLPVRQLSKQTEDLPKSPDIRQEVLSKSRSASVSVKPAKPDPSAFVEQASKPRPIPPPKPEYLNNIPLPVSTTPELEKNLEQIPESKFLDVLLEHQDLLRVPSVPPVTEIVTKERTRSRNMRDFIHIMEELSFDSDEPSSL